MRAPAHPLSYRVLSLLLDYPEQPLIDALPELDSALADVEPALCAQLAPNSHGTCQIAELARLLVCQPIQWRRSDRRSRFALSPPRSHREKAARLQGSQNREPCQEKADFSNKPAISQARASSDKRREGRTSVRPSDARQF